MSVPGDSSIDGAHGRVTPSTTSASTTGAATKRRKLTYAEELELDGLLERVDAAEDVVRALEAEVAAAGFYAQAVAEQQAVFAKLEQARAEASALAERWTELEELRQ